MAAGPQAMIPPPPGGSAPSAPTSPIASSPAPAAISPQTERGSAMVLSVVQGLRGIAQSFPAAAPLITQINDLMRQVQMKIMQQQPASEPAAPPNPQ